MSNIKGLSLAQSWSYLEPYITSITIMACELLFGILIYWLINKFFDYLFRNINNIHFKLFKKYWQKPLIVMFVLFFLFIIHPFIEISNIYVDYYNHAITLATIGLFTFLIIQIFYTIRDIVFGNVVTWTTKYSFKSRKLYTKINILIKILTIIVILVGFSLALMTFPKIKKIGFSILASAGIVSIIMGLAAQKSLSNIFAGIQIAFTQPISIGDEIIVANEWGIVDEITLTYVVVRVWDNRRLIVPINYFIENIFQNWTRNSSDLIATVFLDVDYSTPIQKLREELDIILKETTLWDGKLKLLQVTDAKAQNIEIRILASVINASDSWDLRCYIREKLIEYLQKNYPDCLPKIRLILK